MADAMARFPGRVLGYCYVNPGYGREALEEIRRCVCDRGFIGVKLYNEYRCDEPVFHPVVEVAIELGVPILQHQGHLPFDDRSQPRISEAASISALARRYPEAMIICAHIAGGGDWEWTIKGLREATSVYLDTSGNVTDEGMVEMAARVLGVDRLLFACDMSMTSSMGRIRSADLPEADKRRILGENMQAILARKKETAR
jgi:predicted TIM-barrel fold metal-dependent hydrolase